MSNIKKRKQNSRNCVWRKKNWHFCSDNNLFEIHCRLLIKNCQAEKYLAINFKYMAEKCKFTPHFVWSVCPHRQLKFVL